MSQTQHSNTKGKPVAVVIGATSKWQAEGRNTLLAHGKPVDRTATLTDSSDHVEALHRATGAFGAAQSTLRPSRAKAPASHAQHANVGNHKPRTDKPTPQMR